MLNLRDDDGWEDAEPEEDRDQIVSLLDNEIFPDVASMLEQCKNKYNFDFLSIRSKYSLDFYGTIKLVNYIRSQIKDGLSVITIKKEDFDNERYLRPVLEDDALLFSLDDLPNTASATSANTPPKAMSGDVSSELLARVTELEEELRRTQFQFSDYRDTVKHTLDDRWNDQRAGEDLPKLSDQGEKRDDDSHYFSSYSYNGMFLLSSNSFGFPDNCVPDIHETMLKDTVRTDAYRDFIYNHKHLFAGKVVLDVGCGTGILSLFCAKAGAAQVIAVDNSAIIDKARENVFNNGFFDKITCLRGKIEEVVLPVEKVDIIVSEWMGYCLLYEAMLDSVIWARDKYLRPEGLMVPSHMNMWIAPMSDPEYVMDHISFWRDIYGFDMKAMQAGILDDAQVLHMPVSTLCTEPFPFLQLNLHSTTVRDLVFKRTWQGVLNKDVDALDGFVIWFDSFFLPSRSDRLPETAKAEEWIKTQQKGVAFTTGPAGKETHWRQGVLFIDNITKLGNRYKQGDHIEGEVEYAVPEDNSRALDLKVSWSCGSDPTALQSWKMK